MSLKQKVIHQALLRGLPVLIFMGIGTFFSYRSGDMAQFRQLIAVTGISTAVAAASAIYDYDVWSVKKKIIVHTICMFVTIYPCLIYSGWYDTSSIHGYVYAFLSFIAFGIVFCTIGYLVSKYILKNVPTKTSSK